MGNCDIWYLVKYLDHNNEVAQKQAGTFVIGLMYAKRAATSESHLFSKSGLPMSLFHLLNKLSTEAANQIS